MERVIKCPGSAQLGHGIVDEDSDFAALGTAAHAFAEYCLASQTEPWEMIGTEWSQKTKTFYPPQDRMVGDLPPADAIKCDKEMADAVAVYISLIEEWHPWDARDQGNSWVERPFYCPSLHKYYWGKADFSAWSRDERTLDIWDYKHGAGVIVEAEESVQGRYYACGTLEDLDLWDDVDLVRIHIVQPRGWHWAGPHRTWEVSTDDLAEWLDGELVPAMDRALTSKATASGEHCRFCPARFRACPQLVKDMKELEAMLEDFEGKEAHEITNEQIGRFLDLIQVGKIAAKAWEKVGYSRIANGDGEVPGWKVVPARSNRTFREGAEQAAVKKFGKKRAFTTPELKSPAQIDGMPGGKAFTSEWAFKPDAGYTLAPVKDARRAVTRDTKSLFTARKKGK